MAPLKFDVVENVIIDTGNILSLNDITRKSGQNPAEELSEAISITVKEFENGAISPPQDNGKMRIYRPSDDLRNRIDEQSVSDLKIGFKIFLNNDSTSQVKEAIEEGFRTLQIPSVQNVVITYKKRVSENEGDIGSLKNIWKVLEEYVKTDKVNQIGLADVEEATFKAIYEWATVKPTIVQINLATCCVVPPTLQAFCKDNDVQLLTHSDPLDILPKSALEESLGVALPVKWVLRFLVHIICRGVLMTKGYLVSVGEK